MGASINETVLKLDPAALEVHAAGIAKLEVLGLGHLGDIQVDAGNMCTGSLAQFIGDERHERVAAQVVATAEAAKASGQDVEAAVLAPLAFFIKREEGGDFTRVQVPEVDIAQKKTS